VENIQKEAEKSSPAIRVENLQKLYRELVAVNGLSFTVEPGEIMGLIGPNGAGKTTTLRAIAGILPPSGGRIEIAGRDLALDPAGSKRLMAYVPDDPHLFDSLTVMEHLRFVASAYGVKDWEEPAGNLLRLLELEDKRDALGSELSRGMRQKLASACALIHTPRVLLFDEPMTGLDPRGIRTMNQAILNMAADGAAVVVSSHLLAMVERLCSSVLVLHHGGALLWGKLEEIRGRFPELASDASLEEVFFRATESGPEPISSGSGEESPGQDSPAGGDVARGKAAAGNIPGDGSGSSDSSSSEGTGPSRGDGIP
jgi:ABC-2 type transport system ATP-binding protein